MLMLFIQKGFKVDGEFVDLCNNELQLSVAARKGNTPNNSP